MLKIRKLTKREFENELLAQEIEEVVAERVTKYLSPDDLLTLSKMVENNDPAMEAFLKTKCPKLDKIIEEEINKRRGR